MGLQVIYEDRVGRVLHVRVTNAPPELKEIQKLLPVNAHIKALRASTDCKIWLVEYDYQEKSSSKSHLITVTRSYLKLKDRYKATRTMTSVTLCKTILHLSLVFILISAGVLVANN